MAKQAVTTSYRKVRARDRARPVAKAKARDKALRAANGSLSPLTLYIMENLETSGMTRKELVEQFHEYDCTGEMVVSLGVIRCSECDYWEPHRATDD